MDALDTLYATVLARRTGDTDTSYVARLTAKGRDKIAQKVGEEAVETVIAAVRDDRAAIISESADLLFHLAILWADADVTPADIATELERRQGVSGLDEKAARKD